MGVALHSIGSQLSEPELKLNVTGGRENDAPGQ